MFGLFGPPNIDKLKAKRDVLGLIKALGYEKNSRVRFEAVWALSSIGDPRAIPDLIKLLDYQKDSRLHNATALALGKMGDARAVEPLIIALKDYFADTKSDQSSQVIAAINSLGKLQDSRAIEPLLLMLKSNGYFYLREAAAEALSLLGWQPKDDEQRALQAVALHEWEIVVTLGAVAVEPLIAAIARSTEADVKNKAFEILGEMTDPRAKTALISALNYSGEKRSNFWLSGVHVAAAKALGKMKDPEAVDPLMAILQKPDQIGFVKEAVAKALEDLGVTLSSALLKVRPSDIDVIPTTEGIWAKCPRRNKYASDPVLVCETDYCCVDMVVSHDYKGGRPHAPKCDNQEMIDFIVELQRNQLYMLKHVNLDEILPPK